MEIDQLKKGIFEKDVAANVQKSAMDKQISDLKMKLKNKNELLKQTQRKLEKKTAENICLRNDITDLENKQYSRIKADNVRPIGLFSHVFYKTIYAFIHTFFFSLL